MNKIFLMGNLTRENDYNQTERGLAYLRNCIAVKRRAKNSEGLRETDFFNFTAFGATANMIMDNFLKGSKILIVGEMNCDEWTDRNGTKQKSYNVLVNEVHFVESKKKEDVEPSPYDIQRHQQRQTPNSQSKQVFNADLPF